MYLAIERHLSLGSSWLTISDHIFIQNIFLFCFYSKWPNIPLWKPIWLKILAQQTTGKILKKSSVWVQTSASSTTSPNKLCQSKSTGWSGHTVHQRFLKFHQHKMTIENNFIINDKIDTYPAFHLIYLLQSLQMLTNRFIVFFIRNKATPEFSHVLIKELGLFCVKRKL